MPDAPLLDLAERGRGAGGAPAKLDRRLFMRLTTFGSCADPRRLVDALDSARNDGVLYEDVIDPRGVALLAFSEDPGYFLDDVARVLREPAFRELTVKPELAMLGRSYSIGYESDLEDTLITRPRERVLNPEWPWAVWYPLRRTGAFAQLPLDEQRAMLAEHGNVGRTYGEAGLASDIRLACHGLDTNDNDFVVGLLGPRLHPLSALVQQMRLTQHTALYLDRIGPFFVGRALWRGGAT
jgi:chlorite dismutase